VPQSISVVTRDQMDARGANKMNEALRYTPGVQPEPFGVEPFRIGNAMRPIKCVMRWLRVQYHAPIGLDRVASRQQEVLDILFLDASAADIDFYL